MLTRIITGVSLALFIFLPGVIFSHTVVLNIICSIFAAIGIYEIIKCFGQRDINLILIPSMVLGASMPILVRYTSFGDPTFIMMVLICIYTLYVFSLPVYTNNTLSFEDVSKSAIMSIYIAVGFSSIVMLRDIPDGRYLFIMAFIGAWATDIFAYFTGIFFGRHKLAPVISPKKTIEGSIGGMILCTVCFVLYGIVLNQFLDASTNLFMYAILGFFSSVVSQLGDLVMSAIKRKNDVKDYGTIFPGHGGVLDRFDSVIAVAPVLYLLCIGSMII